MTPNMNNSPLTDMTPEQFRNWLYSIAEHPLFADRERLLTLLTADADREALTEAFREFFEGYYYEMAFELDRHETCLLSIFNSCDTYAPLMHRVAVVARKRKASPMGREVRRMGSFLPSDPVPQVQVRALSNRAFRSFLHTLVNSEFFAARDRVVKLLNTVLVTDAKSSARETTDTEDMRLREAVYEFFVCHLELEQSLEDYAYDPDEGVGVRSEVTDELEQSSVLTEKRGRFSLKEIEIGKQINCCVGY